jgi:tRNA-dihydrouridine synthase
VRSAQLYGVQPELVQAAAAWLVQQRGVRHVDLNFGCPVRKVTARGGELPPLLPLRPCGT